METNGDEEQGQTGPVQDEENLDPHTPMQETGPLLEPPEIEPVTPPPKGAGG